MFLVPWVALNVAHSPEQNPFCGGSGQRGSKGHQSSPCVQFCRGTVLVNVLGSLGASKGQESGVERWPTAAVNPFQRNLTQVARQSSQGVAQGAKFLSFEGPSCILQELTPLGV